ncbi:hypothetical protein [Saccharopolyspora cebuensis]|uniref:Uncharacterized protein n=1 Tax=Saccharopolyspora cebuensis TaxID=418759 RepID=A0ABV4CV62_9PSEU
MREITNGLQALVATGFQFAHPRDDAGELVAVLGLRVHRRGTIDVLQLFAEDDAEAARVSADEHDVLSPRRPLWRTSGRALDVIHEMLHLGNHDHGLWVTGTRDTAAMLAASA